MLVQALDLAREAVRLDSALKVPEAYEAYWQSSFLIRQVLDTLWAEVDEDANSSDSGSEYSSDGSCSEGSTEIQRLTQIYNGYQDRMALLATRIQWPASSSVLKGLSSTLDQETTMDMP